MDDSGFVTLVAGGMQPEPSPSPLSSSQLDSTSQRESSPASSVSATTHDTSRTKYHIDELGTFAARLDQAAASIFPNKGRSRYKDVRVLLLRWEEDTMGVQYELEDLAKAFKSTYGFETETYLIPTVRSHFALMGKALQIVEDFGKAENLLIVYYAGHGLMNASRQALWTCKSDINYASLQWYAIQTLFEQAESDVLLLLDCCAAASGAPTEGYGNSVTEAIAACGFETWAPQSGRHSFTNTLIAVLDDWQDRPAFTAAMLHCEVLNRLRHEKPEKYRNTKNFEFRKSPIHIVSTSDPKARSVELASRSSRSAKIDTSINDSGVLRGRGAMMSIMEYSVDDNVPETTSTSLIPQAAVFDPSNDVYDMNSLTKVLDNSETALPQVLVSLALEEDQLLDFERCRRWLQDFPALAKFTKVHGVFKSSSTLAILSLPVAIWDWLPDDPACGFIGYVNSQNLLERPSVEVATQPKIDEVELQNQELEQIYYSAAAAKFNRHKLPPTPTMTPTNSRPASESSYGNYVARRSSVRHSRSTAHDTSGSSMRRNVSENHDSRSFSLLDYYFIYLKKQWLAVVVCFLISCIAFRAFMANGKPQESQTKLPRAPYYTSLANEPILIRGPRGEMVAMNIESENLSRDLIPSRWCPSWCPPICSPRAELLCDCPSAEDPSDLACPASVLIVHAASADYVVSNSYKLPSSDDIKTPQEWHPFPEFHTAKRQRHTYAQPTRIPKVPEANGNDEVTSSYYAPDVPMIILLCVVASIVFILDIQMARSQISQRIRDIVTVLLLSLGWTVILHDFITHSNLSSLIRPTPPRGIVQVYKILTSLRKPDSARDTAQFGMIPRHSIIDYSGGLSRGVKAGVGASIGVLILIPLSILCNLVLKRRRSLLSKLAENLSESPGNAQDYKYKLE